MVAMGDAGDPVRRSCLWRTAFEHIGYRRVHGFQAGLALSYPPGNSGQTSRDLRSKELVRTGVYGIVRHPMYLAGLVIFTFNPIITVNGLTVTVLADLYFLFGVFIEERRFLNIFGDRVPGVQEAGAKADTEAVLSQRIAKKAMTREEGGRTYLLPRRHVRRCAGHLAG